MGVFIPNMQLPEKCCKCPILEKHHSVCQMLRRRVVDPGKRHADCPLEEVKEACP